MFDKQWRQYYHYRLLLTHGLLLFYFVSYTSTYAILERVRRVYIYLIAFVQRYQCVRISGRGLGGSAGSSGSLLSLLPGRDRDVGLFADRASSKLPNRYLVNNGFLNAGYHLDSDVYRETKNPTFPRSAGDNYVLDRNLLLPEIASTFRYNLVRSYFYSSFIFHSLYTRLVRRPPVTGSRRKKLGGIRRISFNFF